MLSTCTCPVKVVVMGQSLLNDQEQNNCLMTRHLTQPVELTIAGLWVKVYLNIATLPKIRFLVTTEVYNYQD